MLIVTLAGCFPKNPRAQTYAKIGEGVAIVGGIVLLATVNTSADCDQGTIGNMTDEACKDRASLLSNIGLGLILAGLAGFIVTVSTSEDDDTKPTTTIVPKSGTTPAPAPAAPSPTPASPDPAPAS